MTLSTHVLDARTGAPAVGLSVVVSSLAAGGARGDEYVDGAVGHTDASGRVRDLGSPGAGRHRLTFDTAGYFARAGVDAFYPEVTVTFEVGDGTADVHIPLLLSPFAYTTYRGS